MTLHVMLRKPRLVRRVRHLARQGYAAIWDTGFLHRLTPAHLVRQCIYDVSKYVVPIVKAFG